MWISLLAGIRTDTQGHPRSTEPFPKSSQRPPVRNGRHLTPAHLVVHHCASTGGQTTLVPEQRARNSTTPTDPAPVGKSGTQGWPCPPGLCCSWRTLSLTALTALPSTSPAPGASLVIHSLPGVTFILIPVLLTALSPRYFLIVIATATF